MSRKLVNALRVLAEDHALLLLGQLDLEDGLWIVEIPVRIIGREEEAIPADPFDDTQQIVGALGLFHRLRREPDMLADVFGRRPFQMRNLAAHLLPMLIEPPAQWRNPSETTFDQHELQPFEALEHAFQDHAGEDAHDDIGEGLVLLEIEGGPTRRRRCETAAETRDMQPERQVVALACFVDRPIARPTQRLDGARRETHLDEAAVARTTL